MDPGTLIGMVLAFVAIFAAMIMEGGSPMAIILIPPLILVFVGTFGAAMAGGPLKDSTGDLIVSFKAALLAPKLAPPDGSIATLVCLAERARKEGLLALEDAVREVDEVFLKRGLELAIDGTDPEELREILEAEVAAKRARAKGAAKVFADMGGYAPTVGIIGTVIGLIHVLESLNEPEKLGHLIAGAFVATLWGVLSANVMWLPMASKIKRMAELECHHMEMVIEGVMAIQSGSNPRMVDQKLRAQVLNPKPAPEAKAA